MRGCCPRGKPAGVDGGATACRSALGGGAARPRGVSDENARACGGAVAAAIVLGAGPGPRAAPGCGSLVRGESRRC